MNPGLDIFVPRLCIQTFLALMHQDLNEHSVQMPVKDAFEDIFARYPESRFFFRETGTFLGGNSSGFDRLNYGKLSPFWVKPGQLSEIVIC
jgi:hypothetical protein